MSRSDDEAVLAAERRLGRVVGVTAILSLVAAIVAVMLAGTPSGRSDGLAEPAGLSDDRVDGAKRLVDFDEHASTLAASAGARCVGLLLMIGVGIYLFRLVRTRDANGVRQYVLWLTLAAPVLMAVATIATFLAYREVSDTLMTSGAVTLDRADGLLDDSGALTAASIADIASRVVAAVWISLIALAAMRVGLLTRFLGYWGVAAGVSLVIIGDAMAAAWVASVGILALGYWPGSRPPAWDSTEPQEIEAI